MAMTMPQAPGHAPRGNGPLGLVDGVNMPVKPIVHGLAAGAHHGACQHDAADE